MLLNEFTKFYPVTKVFILLGLAPFFDSWMTNILNMQGFLLLIAIKNKSITK